MGAQIHDSGGVDFSSIAVKVREDFSLWDGDSLLDVFVVLLVFFWSWSYWTYCRGRIDDMAVFTLCDVLYLRYDGNSTFNQHNQVSPPLGTLETRDIGTPSRSTGTLEPRGIGTPSAHGGERAPTRGTAKGTDPRNGFLFFRYTLSVTGGLSAARFIAEPLMEVTTSWVVHVGCRYSFWSLSFPETLVKPSGGTGVNAPKRRLMPFEQRLMPLESLSQLKGMKVNAFSEDFA